MKKFLIIVGVVLAVLIVAVSFFSGTLIKMGINKMGPRWLGVPVKVDGILVNPFSGVVHINGLVLGNPEGFATPNAMELEEFNMEIAVKSLFSDTLVIRKILITDPQITYEQGLRDSNLTRLQKSLTAKEKTAVAEEVKPVEAQRDKTSKKVIIEDFQFNGAKVHVSLTALAGKQVTLPLPEIHLTDIGKSSGGATPVEIISKVFRSISGAVVNVVATTGDLAGDILKGAGSAATDVLKDAGGTATDVLKGTGGTAADAAESTYDSIKKGFGKLLGK
jgi:uncharacterized protein involved in outer membrane biogenesis